MPLNGATRLPVILADKQEPLARYDFFGIAIPHEIEIEGATIDDLGRPAHGVRLHQYRQKNVVGLRLCAGQDQGHLCDRIGPALAVDLAADRDLINGVRVDQNLLHRDSEDAPEALTEDRVRVAQLASARVGCSFKHLLECHDVLRCHLRPVIVTEKIGKAPEMGFPLLFRLRIIDPLLPRPFRDQRREGGLTGIIVYPTKLK